MIAERETKAGADALTLSLVFTPVEDDLVNTLTCHLCGGEGTEKRPVDREAWYRTQGKRHFVGAHRECLEKAGAK